MAKHQMPEDGSERDREWGALYRDLVKIVTARGSNIATGGGDFWVLDDDWGGRTHRVDITRLENLTDDLVDALQALLRQQYSAWSLHVPLVPHPFDPQFDPMWLVIHPNQVEHHIDRTALRQLYGARFRYTR